MLPSPACWPTAPSEPPALRVASLREEALDCPQCRLRREGAFLDTRLFPLKMACVRHGYWLYRAGAGSRLPAAIIPEISRAQRRLARIAARHGTDAAVRAYDIARRYLWEDWRTGGGRPIWYDALGERWYDSADAAHPECVALAAMFASPFWAELAVPAADRRHRLFYQHMLAVLGIDNDWARRTASIRSFGTLPEDIREQAGWGRLLSDPDWGSPLPLRGAPPRKIPFIDIADSHERSAA